MCQKVRLYEVLEGIFSLVRIIACGEKIAKLKEEMQRLHALEVRMLANR
jgi:hypothetical protein